MSAQQTDAHIAMAEEVARHEDAERYRWLCRHPRWQFIETLCLEFGARDASEFKTGMDRAIDSRRLAGVTDWQLATDRTQAARAAKATGSEK